MKRGHEATNISPRPATTGLVLSANRYDGGRMGDHESMCQAVSHRVFKFFVVDEVGIAATGIWLLGFCQCTSSGIQSNEAQLDKISLKNL